MAQLILPQHAAQSQYDDEYTDAMESTDTESEAEATVEETPVDKDKDCQIPSIAEPLDRTQTALTSDELQAYAEHAWGFALFSYHISSELCDATISDEALAKKICDEVAVKFVEVYVEQPKSNPLVMKAIKNELKGKCPDGFDDFILDNFSESSHLPECKELDKLIEHLFTLQATYENDPKKQACVDRIDREVELLYDRIDQLDQQAPQRREDLKNNLAAVFGVADGDEALDFSRMVTIARKHECPPLPAIAEPSPDRTAEPTVEPTTAPATEATPSQTPAPMETPTPTPSPSKTPALMETPTPSPYPSETPAIATE